MTTTGAPLRCPDHDVQLEHRPTGDTIRAMRCPVEADSFMSTRNRWCSNCGARYASWMSGTCDSCYRILEREAEANKRESRENYVRRRAVEDAAEKAQSDGHPEIAEWITQYKETLP